MTKKFIWPLVSILPLSAIYAPAVQAIQYLTVEQLQLSTFPAADLFEPFELELSDTQREEIESRSDSSLGRAKPRIWRAQKGGELLGYLVVDDVLGKHDYITFGFSLRLDGSIGELEILEYREAKGQEVVRQEWRSQFNQASLSGGMELDNPIQNISGATLSCKHIIDRVRAWLNLYQLVLKR